MGMLHPRPSLPLTATFAAALALGCSGGGNGDATHATGDAAAFASADVGHPDRNADLPVGPVDITLTNTGPRGPVNVPWVAFSDGDGPWHEVMGRDGVYTFQVRAPRFGLAYLCPHGIEEDGYVVGHVIQATVLDLQELRTRCQPRPARPGVRHRLDVKIIGVPAYETLEVFLGSPETLPLELTNDSGYLGYDYEAEVIPGTYDVTVLWVGDARRALVRRGVAVQANTVVEIDMDREGISLVDQDVRVTQVGRSLSRVEVDVELRTENASSLPFGGSQSLGGAQGYRALPAAVLAPGEVQQLRARSDGHTVVRGFRVPVPMHVELMRPHEPKPELTIATRVPYARARASFTPHPEADFYELTGGESTNVFYWMASVSAGWLEARTSYEFPDLSGAPGWKKEWGPQAEGQPFLSWAAVRSNRPLGESIGEEAGRQDGAEVKSVVSTQRIYGP